MSSAIPGALDTIKTALATALTGVDVYDGPTLDGDQATPADNIWRSVWLGWDPDTEEDTVEFEREWAGIGQLAMNEEFAIPGYLDCVSGDEAMTPLRTAAFDLLDEITSVVVALDITSVYETAVHGRGSLSRVQDENGAKAVIRFVIRCKSRIQTAS